MKKILVPIDFTTYSNNAFRLATYIARIKGMSIKLLHIIEESSGALSFLRKKTHSDYVSDMEETTTEHLKRLVSLENTNALSVEYEVRRSKAGIAKEILKEECDLIIMGRKREENEEAPWAGSVAEKIVRLSAIPVLTVGKLPQNYALRKIAFAADFEDEEHTKPILKRVRDLADIFQSELFLVYLVLNREFINETLTEEKVRNITRNYSLNRDALEVYVAPTEEEGLSDYIEDALPDLLVLCTHGRSGISHFFLGSVSENMADYGTIPVLTYNISRKKMERSAQPITRGRMNWSKSKENI